MGRQHLVTFVISALEMFFKLLTYWASKPLNQFNWAKLVGKTWGILCGYGWPCFWLLYLTCSLQWAAWLHIQRRVLGSFCVGGNFLLFEWLAGNGCCCRVECTCFSWWTITVLGSVFSLLPLLSVTSSTGYTVCQSCTPSVLNHHNCSVDCSYVHTDVHLSIGCDLAFSSICVKRHWFAANYEYEYSNSGAGNSWQRLVTPTDHVPFLSHTTHLVMGALLPLGYVCGTVSYHTCAMRTSPITVLGVSFNRTCA